MPGQITVHTHGGDAVVFDSSQLSACYTARVCESHTIEVVISLSDARGVVKEVVVRRFPACEATTFDEA